MTNKLILLLVGGMLWSSVASARTRPVADGVSPDGKEEVVVSASNSLDRDSDSADAYNYDLVVRARPTGRVLFRSNERWQHSFFSVGADGYDLRAYWSADSHWVALAFQGSGHARVLRVFALQASGSVREVTLAEFAQPVLDALGGGSLKSLEIEPVRWSAHRLDLRVTGTTADPAPATNSTDFSFSAHLQVQDQSGQPKASLSTLQKQLAQAGT